MPTQSRTPILVITLVGAVAVLAAGGLLWWQGGIPWSGFRGEPRPNPAPEVPPKHVDAATGPWLQDFAAAKVQAAREKKDILLSFEGSDWCIWCQRMEREIFTAPEFLDKAPQRFVLMKIDFPEREAAFAQVRDPAANEALQRQFGVTGFPALILTDAQGDVYGGVNGFVEGGPGPLLNGLDKMQQVRVERDRLLAEVEKNEGAAKLPAAKQAMQFLMQRNLAPALKRRVPEWLELAQRFDPKNDQGYVELFFAFDWFNRFQTAPTEQLPGLLDEVAQWKKKYGDLKDKEQAAFLWMELAKGKTELEDFQGAFQCLDEGLKLEPKDHRTRQLLQNGPLALGLGTGTAFAVSAQGHYLTNAHVAAGPGKVFLQLAGSKRLVPAQLIAEKQDLDLALLKIDGPAQPGLTPLPIAAAHVPRRGEEVGAWGYPLGTTFGHGLKLTKGVVSGLPEPATRNMILLDVRINPGNSGSPLCDAKGNVIGIVTARSQGFAGDAYGMALPAKELAGFLGNLNLPPPTPPGADTLAWDEIDRRVSAGVAMVIKARPPQKKVEGKGPG